MCIEDVRLGREKINKTTFNVISASSLVTSQMILQPNADRTSILFCGFNDSIYLINGQPSAAGYVWRFEQTGVNPLLLKVEDVGQLVLGAFFSYGVVGDGRLMITETILRKH